MTPWSSRILICELSWMSLSTAFWYQVLCQPRKSTASIISGYCFAFISLYSFPKWLFLFPSAELNMDTRQANWVIWGKRCKLSFSAFSPVKTGSPRWISACLIVNWWNFLERYRLFKVLALLNTNNIKLMQNGVCQRGGELKGVPHGWKWLCGANFQLWSELL